VKDKQHRQECALHVYHLRGLVPFPPLQFILVREYLIAYAPEEKPLWAVAVMHARRSPRIMAAILRGRE